MTTNALSRRAAVLTLVSLLLALAATLLAASGAHAAASCLAPRADAPGGATFTITSGDVERAGTISFSGTAFTRAETDGLGQTLAFKFNDQVEWAQTVKAADDGTVSGTLSLADLPAADVDEMAERACGNAWVRVLVGSSAAGDMAPSRSVHATFTLADAGSGSGDSAAGSDSSDDDTSTGTAGGKEGTNDSATGGSTDSSAGGSANPGGSANTQELGASGQLPQTGIEDTPPVVWAAIALGIGALALIAEWLLRRRAGAGSAG